VGGMPDELSAAGYIATPSITIRQPSADDAADIWRLTATCAPLDLNAPYVYLLWCRDFCQTSIIARNGSKLVGFVTGYLRPGDAATLMVWQVGVSPAVRRQGIATAMIDKLIGIQSAAEVSYVEATVTSGNLPSRRLFHGLARGWKAPVQDDILFTAQEFPLSHPTEYLYRIGPISAQGG